MGLVPEKGVEHVLLLKQLFRRLVGARSKVRERRALSYSSFCSRVGEAVLSKDFNTS